MFFVSGASALVFEILLFHQTRLVLGSSAWAMVVVPAGFMLGLGLGNTVAMLRGDRIARPLRAYAALEVLVAGAGVALVCSLPRLASTLGPVFEPVIDKPALLAALRLVSAFLLLLVPASAMGATLPLVTRALAAADPSFGAVLGKLYGWNTLGAVAGAVLAETVLIGWVGIRGASLVAGGLNLLAAAGALAISSRSAEHVPVALRAASPLRAWRFLVAAFLSGFALLALEIIWFRFLSLYVPTRSLGFALMLVVVLAGIAVGGLLASVWQRRAPNSTQLSSAIAWAAGAMTVVGYVIMPAVIRFLDIGVARRAPQILELGIPLMLPVSMLSGVLFTLLGSHLRSQRGGLDASVAGALTLCNTVGAALGAFVSGFVLLPSLGMERSFVAVALLYGVVGLLILLRSPRLSLVAMMLAGAGLTMSVVLFPFGSMHVHLDAVVTRWTQPPRGRVEVREGLTETVQFVERRFADRTRSERLLTNGISMSASDFRNRRYMKLFVYWPVALHPGLRHALLISYGVGATARALADTRELETIDVVDVSRDILEMSRIVFPDPERQPLRDPRVRVHIEDGRFFLQTTHEQFDLITGEPPPPDLDGVVNLYSREYFSLMREHLAEGGIATYWLPTHSLSQENALAVIHAFCDALPDCSLWNGAGSDWMLAGTRNARGPVSEERFRAQWADPTVATELAALGFERPEDLGALFIADATYLRAISAATPPVVDDFPKRIVAPSLFAPVELDGPGLYGSWSDTNAARSRFVASALVAHLWPEPLRSASLGAFDAQRLVNRTLLRPAPDPTSELADVDAMLRTSLHSAVAWRLGSDSDVQSILAQLDGAERAQPEPALHLAIQQISERRYEESLEPLALAATSPELAQKAMLLRVYVLSLLKPY